ncbi:MAG: hypothetical protein ACLFSE_05690 [Spirochaetia bacterium]
MDDFYEYAKNNSKLDFCAPLLFSYNTCIADVWERVMNAADRHKREGSFAAFPGFECGTPPDDSHRCVYFLGDKPVPPIFCETRPPALDPNLLKRLNPAAVICGTLEELYKTVANYGGIGGGHFHTISYRREQLFEIRQKQEFGGQYQKAKRHGDEEKNLYEYLTEGKHFGITGGSDTHDSMLWSPGTERFEIRYLEKPREVLQEEGTGSDFYLVKAVQSDGHRGWTSPIRIG